MTADEGDTLQGRIFPLSLKSTKQGLQSEDLEKRGQGTTMPIRPFDHLPITCFAS